MLEMSNNNNKNQTPDLKIYELELKELKFLNYHIIKRIKQLENKESNSNIEIKYDESPNKTEKEKDKKITNSSSPKK